MVLADPGGSLLDAEARAATDRAISLGGAVAAALQALHTAGRWHLDLHPSDMLLTTDGPMLISTGAAAPVDGAVPVPVGAHHGGRAPERSARVRLEVDGRADQYGLGALLSTCLTGRVPHATAPGTTSSRPSCRAVLPPQTS